MYEYVAVGHLHVDSLCVETALTGTRSFGIEDSEIEFEMMHWGELGTCFAFLLGADNM